MSGQTSCGAEVHGEYLPWGYSDKGILPLLLPVVCMGVYVAHLTLLLKDRHLLAQASGESLNQIYPSNEPHTGQGLSTCSLLFSLVIGEEKPKGSVDHYDSKVKDVMAGYCQSIIFPPVGPLEGILGLQILVTS